MSIEQLRERMPALRQREQTLRAELQAIADQANDQAALLRLAETLTAFLVRLHGAADTLSITERQRIVRLVVKDVLIGDDTITIRHSIPVLFGPPQGGSLPPSQTAGPNYLLRKGRDTPTLNCSYLAVCSLALFQHACLEPFLDQAHDAPVGYAVLDKLHQPSLIESVIKLPDVGIEHPVHFLRSDPDRQRIQRLVWATPWSESIRESQEVLFADRVQYLDGGTLDDLIFQRGNPEWPKLTQFTHLRDINSAHRSCSVGSSLVALTAGVGALFGTVA